jgi:secreted Zn-dependent insulinase-like peptidase
MVQLRVNGYNQKLPLLAEKIVDKMRTLEIRQDRFDIFKEKVGSHHASTRWWWFTPRSSPHDSHILIIHTFLGHRQLGREYRNYIMNQPWDHSRHELEMLLLAQNWDFPEKIRALERMCCPTIHHHPPPGRA